VILRILTQESLDLELWLKRYEFLKFLGYFCGFSEARDLFGIISEIPDRGLISEKPEGLSAKLVRSGPWVDFTRVQGPLCKISEISQNNELFPNRKSRAPGPRPVDRDRSHGAPWTHGGADRGHGGAVTGARASASSAHGNSPAGVQQREGNVGNSEAGSPRREWQCGGRASAVQNRRQWCSVEAALERR
jgi:hypothetical protein